MIDIHILLMPENDNPFWVAECLDSLKNTPCNLQVTRGIRGDLGKARMNGFALGHNQYVSWADPDDIVVPAAFAEICRHLDQTTVLYTDQILIDEGGRFLCDGWSSSPWSFLPEYADLMDLCRVPGTDDFMHHLTIIPRWAAMAAAPVMDGIIGAPEPALIARLHQMGLKFKRVPVVGYQWRIHRNQAITGPLRNGGELRD